MENQGELATKLTLIIHDLENRIQKLKINDGFYLEFESIETGQQDTVTFGKTDEARTKNRYPHIYPYDHSRVSLSGSSNDRESGYINASFIKHHSDKVYIASQGPMNNTLTDFWQMVWQQDCPIIVMLANVMENGQINCDQYWPEEAATVAAYGEVKVKLTAVQQHQHNITARDFNIYKNDQMRTVKQFHFTGWPDLNVPDTCSGILALREMVNGEVDDKRGPVIVHCRAGVGRTGTFLTIDYVLKQARCEGKVDVASALKYLRTFRMNLIETVPQYAFVYQCVLEALKSEHSNAT